MALVERRIFMNVGLAAQLSDDIESQTGLPGYGESSPMSTLIPSSMPPLNSATFDSAAITQDRVPVPSSLSFPTVRLTKGSLRFLVKRAIDLTGALLGLLLLAPVMGVIALLIRLDSRGPVLFKQLRRGYQGQAFWILKFRTMSVNAEQQLVDLESSNESDGGVLFKLRNDPRITRLGATLRRYSLDEIPQLINVLKGEMSLVGPRPLQLRDSDLLLASDPDGYHRRLAVLPGITGLWQVSGRSELNYERMVDLDIDYVQNWTLGRDLWIICKTFFVVLRRVGAY
jgi:lipopolysaccharide/colanic/teichoic acid biosynthesis glycosyltransferase